ncbi:glycoside hydrolase family 15 protein [Terrarubrum flagellatum]|uniref:glycoside hydrolase family 15 protein n=1 Tax=Terrirubrum flagellatum TaxID=2895980 RepID=UPI0031454C0F
MSKPLEDYALIGNAATAALVARDGSIDWLCLPRFDSGACFAALLGDESHGYWRIAPDGDHEATRDYLPGTAVLETKFRTATGEISLIDHMPFTDEEEKSDVVRVVRCVKGEVAVRMELALRFDYGQTAPWVRRRDYGLTAVAGPHAIELHARTPLVGRDMVTTSEFTLREKESASFTLSYHPSNASPRFVSDHAESLDRTVTRWREWTKQCRFESDDERWTEAVRRSLITLKLLTFAPTGGIVAAPTTSLPEAFGGSRNWDYRYCWLRDSALTLYALLNAGYRQEAESWRQWLLRAAAGRPDQLRILYGVAGERWIPELIAPWLPGYENSSPVRVGNAAAEQAQLDVYGELLDVLHTAREADLSALDDAWKLEKAMLAHVAKVWREPDQGIWESRGPARHYTHSRLMCWVAFDRAVKSAERFRLDGPVDEWRALRDEIHADICKRGFDAKRNCFVQYYGGEALDASLLLMPQAGFLPPDDPRIAGTIAAIEHDLTYKGLVRRYDPRLRVDGVDGDERLFLACSFWLADAYVMSGRLDEAKEMFERLLALRNDVGLLAEEFDPATRRLTGNFPQGFSHIGLVNTAFNLVRAYGPARQRAEGGAPKGAQVDGDEGRRKSSQNGGA